MALSDDLISQFVKVTKDKTKDKGETIVYGTVQKSVAPNGLNYVKIDGSDLLTPISSTTVISANDRVTVMLKNHSAVVTGNLTSPAARSSDTIDISSFNIMNARIDTLETTKLSAADIDGKYANIDFSNISKATMAAFYMNSGLIQNAIVGDSTITGKLVGVTIGGDLIENSTIKAGKLVINGADGLYSKLNTDGMTTEDEQTNQNSLDGSIVKAKSIAATKISITDLFAFGATIGGFIITDSALYSGAKSDANNITRGIYLGKDAQAAIGDETSYIKYYKDSEGNYKLDISADNITLSNGQYILGNSSAVMYYQAKNVSETNTGDAFKITSGNNTAENNTSSIWFFGAADTKSRYIGSYLAYNRIYSITSNMVVTDNGIFGRSPSSSQRYVKDIQLADITELKGLYDLPVKKFKYNDNYIATDDELYNKDLYGFTAEDLESILPCAVQHKIDENGELYSEMWNSNIIVPSLLKLIQDLNSRLKVLEEKEQTNV